MGDRKMHKMYLKQGTLLGCIIALSLYIAYPKQVLQTLKMVDDAIADLQTSLLTDTYDALIDVSFVDELKGLLNDDTIEGNERASSSVASFLQSEFERIESKNRKRTDDTECLVTLYNQGRDDIKNCEMHQADVNPEFSDGEFTYWIKKVKQFAFNQTQPDTPQAEFNVYEVAMNSGGTGVWSSIIAIMRNTVSNEASKVFEIASGDRCNDGFITFEELDLETGVIRYSTAATPFRLLNPLDDEDQRINYLINGQQENEWFNGWRPYDDIENSAASCVGRIHKHADPDGIKVVGVSFEREFLTSVPIHSSVDSKIQVRDLLNFSQWQIELAAELGQQQDSQYYSLEEWQSIMTVLEN